MTDVPRYATFRDYVQVLRRSRLIIVAAIVLFGVGAYLLTAGDKNVYQTEATLSFQDVFTQTGELSGLSLVPSGEAQDRVAINAATLTRPNIVNRVAKLLPRVSRRELTSGVSAAEETSTGFLLIQVNSDSPQLAAALAQAYAEAVQDEEQLTARSTFGIAAAQMQGIANEPTIKSNPIALTVYQERIADLKFDAETASPVSIATNASVPTTPISPHPVRDALLGIFLGLVLGILVAFARDALDRRLRGTAEITHELEWPIMGHIREATLGHAGFISVNGHKRLDDADLEGFRILRQNIQFLNVDEPPRSLVITSAKPEEGKSTVAASLACASALTGKLTLLIDCDLRRPSLAKKLGVDAEPGLTDYLLGEAEPADILHTIPLGVAPSSNGKGRRNQHPETELVPAHVQGSQLVFIPAGRTTAYPTELLSSKRLRSFLEEVSKAYDLVVIDTSPVLPVADALGLILQADGALICVRGSRTGSGELRAVKQAIDRLPKRPTGVVITGVRSGSEAEFGYYSYQYK